MKNKRREAKYFWCIAGVLIPLLAIASCYGDAVDHMPNRYAADAIISSYIVGLIAVLAWGCKRVIDMVCAMLPQGSEKP